MANAVQQPMNSEATLVLEDVSKSYEQDGEPLHVVEPTSLFVDSGELFVILGPSGCGKTTLLRMIAGLERPSSGRVLLEGRLVVGPARERGMVFQDFTSFPWLTVSQNIAYGLRLRPHDRNRVDHTVSHWVKVMGLEGFEAFYPKDLSGGMQQRVAIARTLANEPRLVLMDEPFGALDAQTRWQMQDMLVQLRRETQTTIVFVTHDVEEAIFLADRIAVCSPRPARILKKFTVPFGEDRSRSITRTGAYLELEQEVVSTIRGEAR